MILPSSSAFSLTTSSKSRASASKLLAIPPNTPCFWWNPERHVSSSSARLVPVYASGFIHVIFFLGSISWSLQVQLRYHKIDYSALTFYSFLCIALFRTRRLTPALLSESLAHIRCSINACWINKWIS